jgi:hypothetical protein
LRNHTSSFIKGFSFYNQISDGLIYCPLDDVREGESVSAYTDLVPNNDVTSMWTTKTQATYWQSCNVWDTTDYIEAGKNDDNEAQVFDMTTFILPSSVVIVGVDMMIYGKTSNTGKQLQIRIKKGDEWLSYGTTNLLTYDSYSTRSYIGHEWTQSEIDNIQFELLTPSMGSGDSIVVYCATVRVLYTTEWQRDMIGDNVISGFDGVGTPEGRASYL